MEMEAAHASPVAALPSQTMTASAHDKAGGTTAVTINMPPPTNTVTPTAAHAKQPITLSWQDLHYAVPVGGKPKKGGEQEMRPLLQGVDGVVRPGKVVAIMGASGAGKSTLLNVLAGRIAGGEISGSVLVNGRPRQRATWQNVIGYVEQDDLMYTNLTVRETLMYAAMLRLPRTMSLADKIKRVDDIIMELGLKKCESTQIGSPETRGISGGERKRVSIAMELVTDPLLLFLDEPTSGLDAFTAANIVESIKNVAVNNERTVLMTIHQPRELIMSLFDEIILLSAGKVVYTGPVEGATQHFEKCGFPCPPNTNPADFFLDVMTVDFRSEDLQEKSLARVNILQQSWVKEPHKPEPVTATVDTNAATDEGDVFKRRVWNNNMWTEVRVLLTRNVKDVLRDKPTMGATIGQAIINVFIMGFIFFQLDTSFTGIQNRLGATFFICVQLTFGNVMPTIAVFTLQREIIKRERAAGTYRAVSAYIAKIISQLPLVWVATLLFGLPVYWMIGFQADAGKYFSFLAIILIHASVSAIMGIMISSGAPNVRVGQIIGPLIIVVFLIFGGQFVNVDSVTPVLSWIKWISTIFYSNSALAQVALLGMEFDCQESPFTPPDCKLTGSEVLDQFGLVPFAASFWLNEIVIASLGLVFLANGYFLFAWRSRPLMKLK